MTLGEEKTLRKAAKNFWPEIYDDCLRKELYQGHWLSEQALRLCVYRAAKDLTVRTMEKLDAYKNTTVSTDMLVASFASFWKAAGEGSLRRWFAREEKDIITPQAFDVWHHKACGLIQKGLEQHYPPQEASYGKAQKIVNMTFKQLYCLWIQEKEIGPAKDWEPYFKYCHMPLDSFTLEWFTRVKRKPTIETVAVTRRKTKLVVPEERKHYPITLCESFAKHAKDRLTVGAMPKWSNICAGEGESHHRNKDRFKTGEVEWEYTYHFFRDEIGNLFNQCRESAMPNFGKNYGTVDEKYACYTPLQAELLIWPDIQQAMAAEGYVLALQDNPSDQEREALKQAPLDSKIIQALSQTVTYLQNAQIPLDDQTKALIKDYAQML